MEAEASGAAPSTLAAPTEAQVRHSVTLPSPSPRQAAPTEAQVRHSVTLPSPSPRQAAPTEAQVRHSVTLPSPSPRQAAPTEAQVRHSVCPRATRRGVQQALPRLVWNRGHGRRTPRRGVLDENRGRWWERKPLVHCKEPIES
jgi:hypothetical protein